MASSTRLNAIRYEGQVIALGLLVALIAFLASWTATLAVFLFMASFLQGLGILVWPAAAFIMGFVPAGAVLLLLISVKSTTALPVHPLPTAAGTLPGGLIGFIGISGLLSPDFVLSGLGPFFLPPTFAYAAFTVSSVIRRPVPLTTGSLKLHLVISSDLYIFLVIWRLGYVFKWIAPDPDCGVNCAVRANLIVAFLLLILYGGLIAAMLLSSSWPGRKRTHDSEGQSMQPDGGR